MHYNIDNWKNKTYLNTINLQKVLHLPIFYYKINKKPSYILNKL